METRVDILGVGFDRLDQEQAIARIEALIADNQPNLVVTPNPEIVIRAQNDRWLKEILNSAGLVLPDGQGIIWAARLFGTPLIERVTGMDLVRRLLARGAEKGYNFYFLGAQPGVARQAKQQIKEELSSLTIATHHGYLDRESEEQVVREINNQSIDILLVGMGSPLQEKWLATYLKQIKVGVGIGVGGVFDILAGDKQRAPRLIQRLGLEWLYRLYQEPSRWPRLGSLGRFIAAVGRQKLSRNNKK